MTELSKKTVLTDNNRKDIVNQFRQILKDEKDVEIDIEDDLVLLRFLRAKEFNVEESVALVHRSRQWKLKNQDLLSIFFEDCKAVYETLVTRVLKQPDKHGRRIIYIQANKWNPDEISLSVGMKAAWYLLEELVLSEEMQKNGMVVILDFGGVPLSKIAYFLTFFTFKQCIRTITFLQGGYPIKVKGLFLISSPNLIATTFNALKYLLKKKMRNRFVVVDPTGPEILHEYLGKENLPDYLLGDIPFEDSFDRELTNNLYSKYMF